ncbi:MAG: alpha/beta hydrolase [Arenimonas sp.]
MSLSLLMSVLVSTQVAAVGSASASSEKIECRSGKPIAVEKYIVIGGIEQWVAIHGADCSKPLVLFIHGGPGNALSPYAHAVYGAWEKDFTLVQWDQRGAGRTFLRNPETAESSLTVELMTQDGIELASYLTDHLHKKKVILLGSSWGTILGANMAKSRPELFHAYLGTGQIVNYRDNQSGTIVTLLALAKADQDTKTITAIEALGPPPWTNPRNFGIARRITRVYEAKTATATPAGWWKPEAQYATPEDEAAAEAADDYSYLQFVGLKGDGMFSRVDLPALGTHFETPIYLIMGASDLVTVPDVAKRYFDSIVAPRKEYFLLPAVGHDPNQAMVDAQYKILKSLVLPAKN